MGLSQWWAWCSIVMHALNVSHARNLVWKPKEGNAAVYTLVHLNILLL